MTIATSQISTRVAERVPQDAGATWPRVELSGRRYVFQVASIDVTIAAGNPPAGLDGRPTFPGAIWAKRPWQAWQSWEPWQREICNLPILLTTTESESHSLRRFRIKKLQSPWANEVGLLQSAIVRVSRPSLHLSFPSQLQVAHRREYSDSPRLLMTRSWGWRHGANSREKTAKTVR